MRYVGYLYEYITVHYVNLPVFRKHSTLILRLLNKLFTLNGYGDLELYMSADIEMYEIDGKTTHDFSAHT